MPWWNDVDGEIDGQPTAPKRIDTTHPEVGAIVPGRAPLPLENAAQPGDGFEPDSNRSRHQCSWRVVRLRGATLNRLLFLLDLGEVVLHVPAVVSLQPLDCLGLGIAYRARRAEPLRRNRLDGRRDLAVEGDPQREQIAPRPPVVPVQTDPGHLVVARPRETI